MRGNLMRFDDRNWGGAKIRRVTRYDQIQLLVCRAGYLPWLLLIFLQAPTLNLFVGWRGALACRDAAQRR